MSPRQIRAASRSSGSAETPARSEAAHSRRVRLVFDERDTGAADRSTDLAGFMSEHHVDVRDAGAADRLDDPRDDGPAIDFHEELTSRSSSRTAARDRPKTSRP